MKRVGIITDKRMLLHQALEAIPNHPERPNRITVVMEALEASKLLERCVMLPSRLASSSELAIVHSKKYLAAVQKLWDDNVRTRNWEVIDCNDDCYMNRYTMEAALLSAGCSLTLVQNILAGHLDSGFAIVRPPGHHATSTTFAGYCFFNNVAICALHAAAQGQKVLIVDFDIHEADGTRSIIQDRKNVALFSIHRWDYGTFYPHSPQGRSGRHGANVLYSAYNDGKGDDHYLKVFNNELTPFAREFAPTLIVVSAGFDAAVGDPLGGSSVTPQGYYQLVKILQGLCPHLALVLEGGYNPDSIADCAVACVQALFDE